MLAATVTANALIFLNQTAVTIALPDIQRDLGASSSEIQWVIGAYLLALAAFMSASGRLADLLGRRRLFAAGLAIFTVASVLCAVAPSEGALIGFRFLQGLGAALVQPLALANITAAIEPRHRGWAIGILATGGTTFLSLGPLIGAGLVEAGSWRLIFLVNVPIALYALAATLRWVQEWRDREAPAIEPLGLLLLLTGFGAIVTGLLEMDALGPGSAATLGLLGGGIVLVAAFVGHELRAAHPLIDVRLLRIPRVAGSLAALVAIQFAVLAVTVYLLLFLQRGLGLSPLEAGALFILSAMFSPLLSVATGKLADRHGAHRLVLAGLLSATAGLLWIALLAPLDDALMLIPGLLVFGVSRPIVFTPAGTVPVAALPSSERGLASGLVTEARQVGAVLGVAVCGAVLVAFEGASTTTGASTSGFQAAMLVAAGVTLAGALAAWAWLRPAARESAAGRLATSRTPALGGTR